MDNTTIDPSKIEYSDTIRLLDPNGRFFFFENEAYRGIYPHRVDFIKRLFADQVVDELMEKKLLIGTYLTERKLDGFGLILRHDRVEVQARPKEWSVVTYVEAAKSYLRLFRELHKRGLALIDGHSSNFSLAPGGRVIWHDFGSIIEAEKSSLHGLPQFLSYFYYPLMLYKAMGDFSIVRRLGLCCTKEDYYRLRFPHLLRMVDFALQRRNRHVWAKGIVRVYRYFTDKYLCAVLGIGRIARSIPSKAGGREAYAYQNVEKFVDSLSEEIGDIPIRLGPSRWGGYYAETINVREAQGKRPSGKRMQQVLQLLEEIQPSRVLDVGANRGLFSHLAYQASPCVISADYDETAVARHAQTLLAMNNDCHIYPVLFNVVEMNDDISRRYSSHTVLALALTHHLRLGQKFPFHFIAEILSRVTESLLITEFMPNGLGVMRKSPDPLPDDYTIETFIAAFERHFRSVRVVDYEMEMNHSPRTMVVCEK